MRISDWSSDVCSSYLWSSERRLLRLHHFHREAERLELRADLRRIADDHPDQVVGPDVSPGGRIQIGGVHRAVTFGKRRSEVHTSELQSLIRFSSAFFFFYLYIFFFFFFFSFFFFFFFFFFF